MKEYKTEEEAKISQLEEIIEDLKNQVDIKEGIINNLREKLIEQRYKTELLMAMIEGVVHNG